MTGKSVEEAKERALDALGVDESEAEFDVLEEAKGGLFGLLRSEARVRARVVRTSVRPKADRRDRRRSPKRDGGEDGTSAAAPRLRPAAVSPAPFPAAEKSPSRKAGDTKRASDTGGRAMVQDTPQENDRGGAAVSPADEEDGAEVAEDFLDGLLDVFGVDYDLERRYIDDDTIELAVTGTDLGLLIGPRGQTLAAIQELTRTAMQRSGSHVRVFVDVAGYREARREALEVFTRSVAEEVLSSGQSRVLDPMPAADRKVVHDTANSIEGVVTSSEGEEPNRHVVISPAG